MKSRERLLEGLHHLGFASNVIACQRRSGNVVHRVMFVDDAQDDEAAREQGAEGDELAAFGLEEIEKVLRVHG